MSIFNSKRVKDTPTLEEALKAGKIRARLNFLNDFHAYFQSKLPKDSVDSSTSERARELREEFPMVDKRMLVIDDLIASAASMFAVHLAVIKDVAYSPGAEDAYMAGLFDAFSWIYDRYGDYGPFDTDSRELWDALRPMMFIRSSREV
ncbi:hypothetical protein [Bifidobacterium tibiigranuli]|jgi:hypothetical protein|uniref:hypothetical protein n=1 Tax=Bifidobacterium tibiigranuli TaxID=2172043 RepID=UPI0023555D3D|nr:hypothetical protein [Bifidobacterium tibiigranuli]MCI1211164.1 hypothetical protein [Bifidobacterium tibiigranuli]MCI1220326.1 hypothetical protein [Bifidobacterium tibiigranuli]MCI1231991.1 hypothetical protein [Bifidobacterium tibiigranuli]